jgi:hypothetical protein
MFMHSINYTVDSMQSVLHVVCAALGDILIIIVHIRQKHKSATLLCWPNYGVRTMQAALKK